MTTPDTAALLALDAARTPGEWRWSDDSGVGCSMFDGLEIKTNQPRIIDGRTDDEVMNCETDTEDNAPYAAFWNTADAEIIVAAVNAIGPLLERVRTLEAEVDRLKPLAESQEIENKVIEEMFG